jgi:hypothetical protein
MMTASEIESLTTDYLTGNMLEKERIVFEQLLEQDERIRHKFTELKLVWDALDFAADPTITDAIDNDFYDMVNKQIRVQMPENRVYSIRPVMYWWASTAAVIIFVFAFSLGKYTTDPLEIIKYKTVQVVKQGPVRTRYVKVYVTRSTERKNVVAAGHPLPVMAPVKTPLMAQLRSPFSSTRISAVLALRERKLNETDLNALGAVLKHDSDPNVQLAIVQTIQPQANLYAVQQLLIDALPFVRGTVQSSIIDILVANRSKEAIPQLLVLLHNDSTGYHTQGQIKLGIEEFLN